MTRLLGLLVLATLVNVSTASAVSAPGVTNGGSNGGPVNNPTTPVPVPEPSLMALLAAGGAYAVARARRTRG